LDRARGTTRASSVTFSKTGAPLPSGGGNVARNHDGMTALPGLV